MQNYELEDLIDSMQDRYATAGEVIIREGDPGDVFVLLEEGKTDYYLYVSTIYVLEYIFMDILCVCY